MANAACWCLEARLEAGSCTRYGVVTDVAAGGSQESARARMPNPAIITALVNGNLETAMIQARAAVVKGAPTGLVQCLVLHGSW